MKKLHFSLFKKIILGSLIASRAAASSMPAVAPPNSEDGAWANVRRELQAIDEGRPIVAFQAWFASQGQTLPLRQAIAESYTRVPSSAWLELDAFWAEYVAATGNNSDAATFMEVRAAMAGGLSDFSRPMTRAQILDKWLLDANCGYTGGGGNCGVGEGGGGGNGTGNEGGGVGPGKP